MVIFLNSFILLYVALMSELFDAQLNFLLIRTDYVDSRGIKRRCLKTDFEELRNQQKRIRTDDQLAAL